MLSWSFSFYFYFYFFTLLHSVWITAVFSGGLYSENPDSRHNNLLPITNTNQRKIIERPLIKSVKVGNFIIEVQSMLVAAYISGKSDFILLNRYLTEIRIWLIFSCKVYMCNKRKSRKWAQNVSDYC